MNNHPPNHPLYNTLGNPPNILLDSMFGMQQAAAADQAAAAVHKPTLIPTQYAYTDMQALAGHHHQAVNLAQSHVAATTLASVNDAGGPTQVLIYQNAADHHQQQPISYKIPQMETTIAPPINVPAPPIPSQALAAAQARAPLAHHVPDKKKDIVAEAASKIFEDVNKKPPANLPTAIKSEPGTEPTPSTSAAPKIGGQSGQNVVRSAPITTPRGGPVGRGRGRGMSRQQIMPRINLLDDEDDGVTCRMCLQSFWYKSQLHDHLKSSHSISDPERYEREEREKKLRRIREDQQRQIMAKRQRMGMSRGSSGFMRRGVGRGRAIAGPRPSFQYRDGAFICDLCKKSFSDGNDMVSHWKSHVKKQRMAGGGYSRGRPSVYPPGRRGPGRPPKDSSYYVPRTRGRGRGSRGGRSDKGKPRWTAYLVWSTRRRKEIAEEGEGYSFAEVARQISNEWKKVSDEEKEKLQDEAEEMNATGQRKMVTVSESDDDSASGTDSDSNTDVSFEEDENGEKKVIKLKIKKEDGEDDGKPRSTRERKRPSFFQEFENEEQNLDKILDEFEHEQIEESKKPKVEKEKKPNPNPTGAGRPRGRRRKRTPSPEAEPEPVELEKSRSGRIRKKPKFQAYFKGDDGEVEEVPEETSEAEDEFKPNESDEAEEEIEEEIEDEELEGAVDEEGEDGDSKITLPLKKRENLNKKIMTDAEIEEATKAAMEEGGEEKADDPEAPTGEADASAGDVAAGLTSEVTSEDVTTEAPAATEAQPEQAETSQPQEQEQTQAQEPVVQQQEPAQTEAVAQETSAVPEVTQEVSDPGQGQSQPPMTSEEELLASTTSSKMEEGDEKFKDIIAESQMDNIFD